MPLIANGERIAELRSRRTWTAADLAERVGTTANYLCQVERGHRNGSDRLLGRIAAAFGVDVTEISEYRRTEYRRGAA